MVNHNSRSKSQTKNQQLPNPSPRQALPAVSAVQAIVDSSRARRVANSAVRAGGAGTTLAVAVAASSATPVRRAGQMTSPTVLAGPKCLSDQIRVEPYPDKFKEPSKISNYDPSMEPEAWLSSYEMAMCIRNA